MPPISGDLDLLERVHHRANRGIRPINDRPHPRRRVRGAAVAARRALSRRPALAIEGIPGDPSTFYFGAVAGGVWRTRDAGNTWQPMTDGQPFASVGALAIAPSDPNTIYVGSGEADMRSDITYGQGMWKSSDGGAHWQSIGLVRHAADRAHPR